MIYEFTTSDMHTKYYVMTIILTLLVATFHRISATTTNGFVFGLSSIVLNPLTKAITLIMWVISIALIVQ